MLLSKLIEDLQTVLAKNGDQLIAVCSNSNTEPTWTSPKLKLYRKNRDHVEHVVIQCGDDISPKIVPWLDGTPQAEEDVAV